MAGSTYWNAAPGATSFGSAGNWTNGVPAVATDIGIFDGRSQVSPATDMDRAAANFKLITTPRFIGDIGGPGNPLKWNPGSGTRNVIRGSGRVYAQGGVLSEFVVDSVNFVDALTLNAGNVEHVFVKSGRVIVGSSCSFPGSGIVVLSGSFSKIRLENIASPTGPGYWAIDGGVVECDRDFRSDAAVDFVMSSGLFRMTRLFGAGQSMFVLGGLFQYVPVVKTGNAIIFYIGSVGVVDASENNELLISQGPIILPGGVFLKEQLRAVGYSDPDLNEEYPP